MYPFSSCFFVTLIFKSIITSRKIQIFLKVVIEILLFNSPFCNYSSKHFLSDLKGFLAIILVLVLTHLLTLMIIKIKNMHVIVC